MKTTQFFSALAAATIMLTGLAACSDNYNAELMPTQIPLELKVDGHDQAFTLECNAAPGNYDITVESNTLWKVEAVSNGGWISLDKVSGKGNESFTISVRDNMIEKRTGSVTVTMIDAQGEPLQNVSGSSIIITVTQDVSAVRVNPSTLAPVASSFNGRIDQTFTVEANVAWTLDITYDDPNSVDYLSITPGEGNIQAAGDGSFSGSDMATFFLNISENRTARDRKAYVNLTSEVGSYSIEITQTKAEYTFVVSPTENMVIAPQGQSFTYTVLSPNSGWDILNAYNWVSFTKTSESGETSNPVETTVTIAPNATGKERTAIIEFQPKNQTIAKQTVTIIQRGYEAAFSASRSDMTNVVSQSGEILTIELDSRFNWTATAPSWLRLSADSGGPSTSIQQIGVHVDANQTNDSRTGYVTLTPLPTVFEGGVTLDPGIFNLGEIRLGVTQFGGHDAAISVPWLADSYTQTSAILEYNFYSPYYPIVEAGIEWSREDGTGRQSLKTTPSNSTDCTVSFELTGLDPATRYVARGYVVDSEGNVKNSEWSYPFTTAGRYPGSSDNPTPSN